MPFMQIDIPESKYGDNGFFLPSAVREWVYAIKATYSKTHSSSSGNGYSEINGAYVSNSVHSYRVTLKSESDATAFAIMFPDIKCHVYINSD